MKPKKRQFTGKLLTPIYLSDARARGLRAALALDADESDLLAHIQEQLEARWTAFDKWAGLQSDRPDIWEQRAKTLVAWELDLSPTDPNWWGRLAYRLACRRIPGFSVKLPSQRRHGAPTEWTDKQLAELFADVEFLKRQRGRSVRQICETLPRLPHYAKRWGSYRPPTLRKAYSEAVKRRYNLWFELNVCGGEALIVEKGVDRISAAIEMHALKK
jgi:hypothetical protein